MRSVAITSTARDEGKTFTACNLTLARASTRTRTLLVDADVRGRGVTRFFDLPEDSPGLCDVMSGRVGLHDATHKLWAIDAPFWVLPAGLTMTSSRDVIDGDRLHTFLARAGATFDLIVLDTPPLGVFIDGVTISAAVNTVLLVVRGGMTDRHGTELTLERLRRAKAHVVGAVLNDVPLSARHYARYVHYAEADGRTRG